MRRWIMLQAQEGLAAPAGELRQLPDLLPAAGALDQTAEWPLSH
jgi:hypothetical protein